MNPRTNLMVVAAILLIIANVFGEDSQVVEIAEMDKGELLNRAEQVSNMDGFTPASELSAMVSGPVSDEDEDAAPRDVPEKSDDVPPDWAAAPEGDSEPKQELQEIEKPEHQKLAPGEVDLNFDPTIRRRD